MSTKRECCEGCAGDRESTVECLKCGKYLRKITKSLNNLMMDKTGDSSKQSGSSYVTHIVFAGIRPNDNVYEVKLLLAPEIDISSVRITVKNKNLRVTVNRPLNVLAKRLSLSSIQENSSLDELVKMSAKHCENFLIPENIDGDKVRAIIDNKTRSLVLTAPTIKPCKALKRRLSMTLDNRN